MSTKYERERVIQEKDSNNSFKNLREKYPIQKFKIQTRSFKKKIMQSKNHSNR